MSFIKTVSELAWGEAVGDYDEALRELSQAVKEHQKAGTLSITLKLTPLGGDQVQIDDSYKVTKPEKDRVKTITFVQRDGSLSRRDPRQPELPMREVARNEPDSAVKEASNG